METLFGLEISKKQKRVICIGIPIGILCLSMYLLLSLFQKEPVYMPEGGLSSSIFDSQNQTYRSEAAFEIRHSFKKVPYTIDTVKGQKAVVGNACVYEHAPYYFYYSEIKQGIDLETVLKKELTSILIISADPEETQLEFLHEENGFINGCNAGFYIIKITAKDTEGQKSKYMALYRLHLDESLYETEWDMLVGCMAEDYSTEGLSAIQLLSFSSIGSLQYDEEAQKRIEAGGK